MDKPAVIFLWITSSKQNRPYGRIQNGGLHCVALAKQWTCGESDSDYLHAMEA